MGQQRTKRTVVASLVARVPVVLAAALPVASPIAIAEMPDQASVTVVDEVSARRRHPQRDVPADAPRTVTPRPSPSRMAIPEIEALDGSRSRPVSDAAPDRASPSPLTPDRLGALVSPDVGDHCAAGLGAPQLSRFFAEPIGSFLGADYQRAIRLADDRVLWTFQDAFVDGALVHNVAMIQSGRCFTLLGGGGRRSWLLDDLTDPMQTWHWILGGGLDAGGHRVHLYVVQMDETGGRYLERPRSSGLRRVVLDARTLETIEVVDEPARGDDLYGWSVTNDATYTYLYSHCYQQFGYDTPLGFAGCSADVKLARIPLGRYDADYEFWDRVGWSSESGDAAPVVDGRFVMSGNNPAQIRFAGDGFELVEKRDDWWGTTVEFGVADRPEGPFTHVASVEAPLRCEPSVCNSYFAAWVPWNDAGGEPIWSIGHNRWDGSETWNHLADYRPSFAIFQPTPDEPPAP